MEEQKIKEIIKDYKNSSNNDLMFVMDFLKEDFDKSKEIILKLTHHLDATELTYNNILQEYKRRNKK